MNVGLQAVGLIEKDLRGDFLWLWIYPSIASAVQERIQSHCSILWDSDEDDGNASTICFHFKNHWIHLHLETYENNSKVCIVVMSTDYNSSLYLTLAQVFLRRYTATESPVSLLETYLEVFTKGSCMVDDTKTLNVRSFDIARSMLTNSKIKDVISMFGVETILLYTAMLLKRRIAIYHTDYQQLADICQSVVMFAYHRPINWNTLYPLIDLSDSELTELRQVAGGYVAGFIDSAVAARTDMYDLFVNASAPECIVAPHARETFAMGKLHKDLATFIVQCAEDEDKSDQQCILDIANKSRELLKNLKSLGSEGESGKSYIVADQLREKHLPPATENFLLNLASVEGLLKF